MYIVQCAIGRLSGVRNVVGRLPVGLHIHSIYYLMAKCAINIRQMYMMQGFAQNVITDISIPQSIHILFILSVQLNMNADIGKA